MTRSKPRFSIVIPTYKRPRQLASCLQALARLDYPREQFEVIIVDDGGTIPPEMIPPFAERIDVRMFVQKHAGAAAARNTGAREAKGTFLAFTDDDCAPAPDWLQRLEDRFAVAPEYMVGGKTINALAGNRFSTASQMLVDYLYAYYNAGRGAAVFFTSNNFALRSDLFHAAGGFDESFPLAAGEDREICDRWASLGHKMTYASEVLVYHSHHLTLRKFWRQHFNYGRGAFHFHRLRARRDATAMKVESLSFYLNLLRYPIESSQGSRWRNTPITALFFISQLANAAGFFFERVRLRFSN